MATDDRDLRRRASSSATRTRSAPRSRRSSASRLGHAGAARRRRSRSTWASARRRPTRRRSTPRSRSSRRSPASAPRCAGPQVDRELQAARGHAGRRARHAARRPHVRVPRPARLDRAAAHPRLPRAQPGLVRRPRQLLARHHASRSSSPRSTTTHVPAIRGLDVAITTTAETDEQGRALLRALGLPFAAERRRDSVDMAKTSLRVKQKRTAEAQGSRLHALQPLRPAARRVPQVQALPDLPARARARGRDPRHDEVAAGRRHDDADRSDRRHADPHPQREPRDARHRRDARPPGMKEEIARLLQDEGYIKDFSVVEADAGRASLVIELKFGREPRARDHRPEAGLQARSPRLRQEGPAPARPRRPRHRDPVHLDRA